MSETRSYVPGFDACMRMMRKPNPQTREDGFHLLRPHAGEYIQELMNAFHQEDEHGLKCWLLELIGEAKSEHAISLFEEYLRHTDETLRTWAARGLCKLNTEDTRRSLWEARSYTFTTQDEARRFQTMLDDLQESKS